MPLRNNRSYSHLPVVKIEIAGKTWSIIDPAAFIADRKRLSRPLVVTCIRCDHICTDVGPCPCCQTRQYDLSRPHERLTEAEVLAALEAYADARRSRRAS